MRPSIVVFAILLLSFIVPFGHRAAPPDKDWEFGSSTNEPLSASPYATYHIAEDTDTVSISADEKGGGIRELIPDRYLARYQQWKKDFLSTETGRQQWARYSNDPAFSLTIVVARENAEGAGTGKYKWDANGKLVAATITLGAKLHEGYPNPIYYPVMNSLSLNGISNLEKGVLAASKIAHEFGHLTRTSQVDASLYQTQSQLIPVYNKIFLTNGRNPSDPRLLDLVQQMRGTPVEIWEDREYWGETNAMLYLRDRFAQDNLRCTLFNRIRQSVDLYASSYMDRFKTVADSVGSQDRCGW